MKATTVLLVLFSAALALTLSLATPARAQATRTWISGVGDDANPCSRTAPCKTFAGAISKTAAGGEIDCLDPGGFGAITITKTITFDCGSGETGQVGSILVAGTNGIVVAAGPTDVVVIKKLSINGIKSPSNIANAGLNGIRFLSGASLLIDNVNIMHFQNSGIDMATNAASSMAVINTNVTDCGNGTGNFSAVHIQPTGSVTVSVALRNVRMTNSDLGLYAIGTGVNLLQVSVDHSAASNNLFTGMRAESSSGIAGNTKMNIIGSSSTNNGAVGILGVGNAAVAFGSTMVMGNAHGTRADSGAGVQSYQNNQINQNGDLNSAPSTILLQ